MLADNFPAHVESATQAIRRLRTYKHVGVSDLYTLSWCLLVYKVHGTPDEICYNATANNTLEHFAHHDAPRTMLQARRIPDEVLKHVDELTVYDRRLFEYGVRRLRREFVSLRRVGGVNGRQFGTHLLEIDPAACVGDYMPWLFQRGGGPHGGGNSSSLGGNGAEGGEWDEEEDDPNFRRQRDMSVVSSIYPS